MTPPLHSCMVLPTPHTKCTAATTPLHGGNPKPADVRMDGSFDVTVERLIRHWCPTLEKKELKWVHQLDFGALATHHRNLCKSTCLDGDVWRQEVLRAVRCGAVR